MNLSDLIYEHTHSLLASVTGAAASVLAPLPDIVTRIIVGTATGVLVWVITKAISLGAKKVLGKKDP